MSQNAPLRLLRNRKIVKKINHVSKHFHFYASVNLHNISDLGIKILLNHKLQIGLYGETFSWSTVRGEVELPSLGGNYCEMWSHCLELPAPLPNVTSRQKMYLFLWEYDFITVTYVL